MNTKTPLVSVICHCYNHEAYVIDSLKAILNQSYPDIEIIIVDDCSNDKSVMVISAFLEKYPKVIFIKNIENLGITKSFNNSLKIAKGDYVIDLAADDVLTPNCVSKQIEAFQKSSFKNLAIVYGNAQLINENSNHISYYFEVDALKKVVDKRPTGYIYESIITSGKTFCSVSGIIKKTVYDALNGYDERLMYEDYDFWIRVSRNYEIDFIDEILIQKRLVKNSLETHFFKKNNSRAKKINYSTYLILKNALMLNKTKAEDLAIQKRINYEIVLCFKTINFILFFKYLVLEIRLRYFSKNYK